MNVSTMLRAARTTVSTSLVTAVAVSCVISAHETSASAVSAASAASAHHGSTTVQVRKEYKVAPTRKEYRAAPTRKEYSVAPARKEY